MRKYEALSNWRFADHLQSRFFAKSLTNDDTKRVFAVYTNFDQLNCVFYKCCLMVLHIGWRRLHMVKIPVGKVIPHLY